VAPHLGEERSADRTVGPLLPGGEKVAAKRPDEEANQAV
jgi:hypothetical protein